MKVNAIKVVLNYKTYFHIMKLHRPLSILESTST